MNILIKQEIELHQYEVRQNPQEIFRLLHPNFREVGESGTTYDYQSILKMMLDEKPSQGHIHSQDYECIQLDSTTQLLLYRSVWIDSLGQKSHFAKRSSIWVKADHGWQMQYHQGTPCPEFKLI